MLCGGGPPPELGGQVTEDGLGRTSAWSGRLVATDLELGYRLATWPEVATTARYLAVAGAVFFAVGFVVDLTLLGWTPRAACLLGARLATAGAVVAATWWLTRDGLRWRRFDYGLAAIMALVAAVTCGIIAVSPGSFLQHALTVLVILLVFYLFVPAQVGPTVAVGAGFSAAFLAVGVPRFAPPAGEIVLVVLYLALANLLGAMAMIRSTASRRCEFAARSVLERARDELLGEVAARGRAEQALAESEARYRGLVELAPDAIMVHRDGRVLYLNTAGVRMVGAASAAEVTASSVFEVVLPEHHEEIARRMARIQQHGETLEPIEIGLRTRDRGTVYCEVVSGPVPFEGAPAIQSVIRDVGDRRRLEAELRRLATTDPLTGVANRRRFFDRLAVEWSRAARHERQLSVLVIDLDRFKQVNDGFGHAVGDEVLCAAVERFRSSLRVSDTLGRLGGEEFAAVLPEIGREGAAAAAERIRAAVAAEPIATEAGPVSLTVSIGCTECRAGIEDSDEALKRADDALYEAKRRGRDRVVVS